VKKTRPFRLVSFRSTTRERGRPSAPIVARSIAFGSTSSAAIAASSHIVKKLHGSKEVRSCGNASPE
jgi:hypothetical protein